MDAKTYAKRTSISAVTDTHTNGHHWAAIAHKHVIMESKSSKEIDTYTTYQKMHEVLALLVDLKMTEAEVRAALATYTETAEPARVFLVETIRPA